MDASLLNPINHRKKVRYFSRVAAALAVCLIAAACGTGNPGTKTGASTSSGPLSVASWQFTKPGSQLWSVLTTYEQTHPKVTLQKVAIPYASYPSTIETQLGAHGGPDILVSSDVNFYQLAEAGLLEPLDTVLPKNEASSLVSSNSEGKVNGKQYGFLWSAVDYAFFWNKKLLAEAGVKPPTNFADFLAAAKTIKAKTGAWGFAGRHLLNEETAWFQDFSGTFLAGYGGSWSKDGKLTIATPENIAAVTAFKQMYDSGAMDIGDDASTFRSKFAQGHVAMMLDNQGAVAEMVKNNNNVTSTDVGASVPPFPTQTVGHEFVFISINKYSKHKALAEAYLQWLYAPSQQQALAVEFGAEPIGTTAPLPASFASANPWASVYSTLLPQSLSLVINGHAGATPKVAHAIMPEIARVLAGQISPTAALNQAQMDAQAVLTTG